MKKNVPVQYALGKVSDDHEWQSRLIKKATSGDIDSAWLALSALLVSLDEFSNPSPLFVYCADFFDQLLTIRDELQPRTPTREELSRALQSLHIVAKRGRPKVDGDKIRARLAAEVIERRKAGSVEAARARLRTGSQKLGEFRQRDLRTEHPEIANIIDQMAPEELKALASYISVSGGKN